MSQPDYRPPRVTATNAGPDSKGIVSVFGWDLEGMVAFYLVGGALLGMLVVLALAGRPILLRVGLGLIPMLVSAAWVRLFVHGRPPSYQSDVFERWCRGGDFRLRPQQWCRKIAPRLRVVGQQEREGRHG